MWDGLVISQSAQFSCSGAHLLWAVTQTGTAGKEALRGHCEPGSDSANSHVRKLNWASMLKITQPARENVLEPFAYIHFSRQETAMVKDIGWKWET